MSHPLPLAGLPQSITAEPVLTVSQLTAELKEVVEGTFPSIWVCGEISNFSRPSSGHCYLTLKDDHAQLRACMWRMAATRVRFDLHDGLEVICQGYLDLYAQRGSYQLVIQQLYPKGEGALERALRQLRERLGKEGLFDAARKRSLPRFPRRVAVVTSPTGAALRDFLEVLRRRFAGVDVLVVPTRVQGDGAAMEIASAIRRVNSLRDTIDVLIVSRGGGSLEDLWPFNEEVVVRAIHGSAIPVVSAVGHEIDVTLSDLVADVRAATPSEAAERVVPASEEIAQFLERQQRRLLTALRGRAAQARARVNAMANCRVFRRPTQGLHVLARQLEELESRSARAVHHRLQRARAAAEAVAGRLNSLSPLSVLGRGYSLTGRLPDERLVLDSNELSIGDRLITRFGSGQAVSRVEEIHE